MFRDETSQVAKQPLAVKLYNNEIVGLIHKKKRKEKKRGKISELKDDEGRRAVRRRTVTRGETGRPELEDHTRRQCSQDVARRPLLRCGDVNDNNLVASTQGMIRATPRSKRIGGSGHLQCAWHLVRGHRQDDTASDKSARRG